MPTTFKKLCCAVAALLVALFLPCCSGRSAREEKRFSASFFDVFDTLTYVVGYAESEEEFNALVEDLHNRLIVYHELYDIYNEYEGMSNLKTVNDNAGIAPVKTDERIIDMLTLSKKAYALTDGKVNVMLGSVLSVWHDYREAGISDPERAKLPPEGELATASEHTDIESLVIDERAGTVYISDPNARLDVGAVAKGYAVGAACSGMPSGLLVSVGGSVCATGPKTDGSDWLVGIQDPDGELGEYMQKLSVGSGSVVTSGDYQRYYTVDGVKYCHIIDPETLYPALRHRAVTVVHPDSGLADALSTALFVLSYDEGLALVGSIEGASAMWVHADGSVDMTPGYAQMTTQ